jgi:hypothetical protein
MIKLKDALLMFLEHDQLHDTHAKAISDREILSLMNIYKKKREHEPAEDDEESYSDDVAINTGNQEDK